MKVNQTGSTTGPANKADGKVADKAIEPFCRLSRVKRRVVLAKPVLKPTVVARRADIAMLASKATGRTGPTLCIGPRAFGRGNLRRGRSGGGVMRRPAVSRGSIHIQRTGRWSFRARPRGPPRTRPSARETRTHALLAREGARACPCAIGWQLRKPKRGGTLNATPHTLHLRAADDAGGIGLLRHPGSRRERALHQRQRDFELRRVPDRPVQGSRARHEPEH